MAYQAVHNDNIGAKEPSTYPRFSKLYNRLMEKPFVRLMFDPLRYETAGHSYGVVLEVGAGGGQNFPFYEPALVVRVEAIEPNAVMLAAGRPSKLHQCLYSSLALRLKHFPSPTDTLIVRW